jgi:hypothetical protein
MPQYHVFGFQPPSRLEVVAQHTDDENGDCNPFSDHVLIRCSPRVKWIEFSEATPMRFLPGIFSSLRRRAAGAPHCIVNPSDWLPFRVRVHPRKEKKGRGVRPLRPFAFRECAPH